MRRRTLRRRSRRRGVGITKFGVTRSEWAWYIDSRLKAKTVFQEPTEAWRRDPSRTDVIGVDYPLQNKFDEKAKAWLREHIVEGKKGEAEAFSKALGTLPAGGRGEISEYYWEKYKSRYPDYKEFKPKYVYAWDSSKEMLKVVNDETGEVLYYISMESVPKEIRHLRGDELAKAYAKHELEEESKRGGDWTELRLVKGKHGWGISEILSPKQQFLRDVEAGKIKENGLKLSVRQVMNLPPASGYLQLITKPLLGTGKIPKKEQYYRRGLVVKITGDFDPDLRDDHNTWAVITEVIDPWHYRVVQEQTGKEMIIRDTDVKAWIGDLENDYIGLGEERHKKEVVPLIKQALRGKIPAVVPDEYMELNPVRSAYARGLTLDEAIKRARQELERLRKNRHRYDREVYGWLKERAERDLRILTEAKNIRLGTAEFAVEDRRGRVRWIPVRVVQIEKGRDWFDDTWFGVDRKGRLLAASGLRIRNFRPGSDYGRYAKAEPPRLVKRKGE